MASQKFKAQLAPPTKYIYGIEDSRANSEIRYFISTPASSLVTSRILKIDKYKF